MAIAIKYGASPAPWSAWFDYDDDGYIYQAGVDSGPNREVNVCMTTCENVEVEDREQHNAIVLADTNLIAAAPALLLACESARNWLAYCDMQDTAQFARLTDAILLAKGGA